MRISDWSSDVCSSDLCRLDFQTRNIGGLGLDHVAAPGNEIQMAVVIDARQIAGRVVAVRCEHLAAIDFVEAGHQGAAAQLQFADLARRQYFTAVRIDDAPRSEEHTSELQSLMRISYAVFCLKKKKK